MTEFLQSIKLDLFSRRLLPFVALLGLALVGAVAYAVAGGSGSPSTTPPASGPSASAAPASTALPVAVAPANPNQAVSETPAGARYQSQGPTRDPFIPLPSPPAGKAPAAGGASTSSGKSSTSSSAGSSAGGSGSASGGSSAGGQKAPAPAPKKAVKPQFPYVVSVLFGVTPTTPGQPATLTPYENLKPTQPLPSKQDTRVAFERVTGNGKGAVFKLVVPPILQGSGVCLPSTSECQTIDLEAGHAEQLEYIEASGQAVVYELKVVSIAKKGAGATAAHARQAAKSVLENGDVRPAQAIGSASSLQVLSR
jgi:hypothetical protein